MNNIPIKKIHLWIGIIGFTVFILSGIYFIVALGGLKTMDNVPRLLLRTSHIYLFLASVINLLFGLYYQPPKKMKWYMRVSLLLIMLSPFCITYGFVFETLGNEGINRPIGSLGIFFILPWMASVAFEKIYPLFKKKNLKLSSAREIENFLTSNPEWSLQEGKLYRELAFKDFAAAFAFMQKIAVVAEEMDHHPDWRNVYNRVEVWLDTHSAGGITKLDFELAQHISRATDNE